MMLPENPAALAIFVIRKFVIGFSGYWSFVIGISLRLCAFAPLR